MVSCLADVRNLSGSAEELAPKIVAQAEAVRQIEEEVEELLCE
jgi:hypothetical protein